MTEDYIVGTGRSNHSSRHLAGVGALSLVGAVLCAQAELLAVDNSLNCSEVSERHANHNVALGSDALESLINFACKLYAFGNCSVHLPVTCYNVFSHIKK